LKSDEVGKGLAAQGIKPVIGAGPAAFTNRMKSDIDKLQQLVATTGVKFGGE
jgi:hypothetical protein